jgi:hypothetical protein
MELNKEDYETIEAIVKAQLEHYNLIQPTAKDGYGGNYTYLANCDYVISTEEAYTAQQQGEWKVGEWVKDKQGNCGLVVEIVDKENIMVDNQSPHGGLITIGFEFILKPTTSEVEAHLVEIAKKKMPIGCKVKAISGTFVISTQEFSYNKDNNTLLALVRNGGEDYYKTVWNAEDSWAETIVEDVKDRFKESIAVSIMQSSKRNYYVVVDTHYKDLTNGEAQYIADKIKALLQTL